MRSTIDLIYTSDKEEIQISTYLRSPILHTRQKAPFLMLIRAFLLNSIVSALFVGFVNLAKTIPAMHAQWSDNYHQCSYTEQSSRKLSLLIRMLLVKIFWNFQRNFHLLFLISFRRLSVIFTNLSQSISKYGMLLSKTHLYDHTNYALQAHYQHSYRALLCRGTRPVPARQLQVIFTMHWIRKI